MSLSLDEKRKSLANSQNDILDARVICDYDDPGLREDKNFDLLSRFLLVFIESSLRIPTAEKFPSMISLVLRPKQLWVDVDDGIAPSPNTQKRSDPAGNISVGLADAFTVAGIPPINYPYSIGESIKIKRLASPLKVGESSVFQSAFNNGPDLYGNWHTQGSTLPYFANNQDRITELRNKNIFQPFNTDLYTYGFRLYKSQYEAFLLTLLVNNIDLSTYATSVFENSLPNGDAIYSVQGGGYVFNGLNGNTNYVSLLSCEFEDININGKARTNVSDCLPIITCVPNQFPTPKVRELGTFSYNPTLIVKQ